MSNGATCSRDLLGCVTSNSGPQLPRGALTIATDSLLVDKRGFAMFNDNAAINDNGLHVTPLAEVYQRPYRVEGRCQMGLAEVDQHHIGLLAHLHAAKIMVAAHRLGGSERCHMKNVASMPSGCDGLLLQPPRTERPTHSLNHITVHIIGG